MFEQLQQHLELVWTDTTPEESDSEVTVFATEDTGIGMTPNQMQKIFLPFEQVGEHSHQVEGTGLGLAISRKIIKMMGGEIKVESTYQVGSKFWFDLNLPEASDQSQSMSAQFNQDIIGYQGKQRTILVVDDHWENRSVIINLLEPIGFKVIEAENGQVGLEVAHTQPLDLIITDLVMPVMDGLEMTQRLRQSEAGENLAIIASSASVFSFDQQQSRAAGCNNFLPKPVQTSELLDQLQQCLELVWICQPNPKFDSRTVVNTQFENIVIPPDGEIIALYQAAKAGYLLEIQQEAKRLKQLDPKYVAFANRVLQLADECDDEAIVDLVNPYIV